MLSAFNAYSKTRVQVRIPSAQDESQLIWQNLRDLDFFEAHNYQVAFPHHPMMASLRDKALNKTLQHEDYLQLVNVMKNEVYQIDDYQLGYNQVNAQLQKMNDILLQLNALPLAWTFKFFPIYNVSLTLYGPGGSFNPDTGQIILQTTQEGNFKNYRDPSNTIIHEIVHIGVEESLVQHFELTHRQKERLVDNIVSTLFSEQLPNYRIQSLGDSRIDALFTTPSDINRLERKLKQLLMPPSKH